MKSAPYVKKSAPHDKKSAPYVVKSAHYVKKSRHQVRLNQQLWQLWRSIQKHYQNIGRALSILSQKPAGTHRQPYKGREVPNKVMKTEPAAGLYLAGEKYSRRSVISTNLLS